MPPNANQSARMFTHHRLLFGRPRTSVQPGQAALRPRICYPAKPHARRMILCITGARPRTSIGRGTRRAEPPMRAAKRRPPCQFDLGTRSYISRLRCNLC